MNFCGIISEFNPFHNGHEYIIREAKKQTGLNVVCLMSGNFVQRGKPAIQNKYIRAKNAVNAGATAVLELPTIFACSNAENFAYGAIKILSAIGVTHIAFGVENTSLEILKQVAELKFKNSVEFKNAFKNEIQNGINFNTALKRAIAKNINVENIEDVLNKPNNILAIEYLTAILKTKSKLIPVAIKRCDNGYYSEKQSGKFLSASAIRNKILNGESYSEFVPKNAICTEIFSKNHQKMLNLLQILNIRKLNESELNNFYDYSEGIEFRIKKISECYNTLPEMVNEISSPRYRLARVNKLLLYPLLGITKNITEKAYTSKPVCKVLAIKKEHKNILSEISKNSINLIVSNKDYLSLDEVQKLVIDIDLNASLLFNTITENYNYSDKKQGTIFL